MEIIKLKFKKVGVSQYDTFDKNGNKINKENQYRISIYTKNNDALLFKLVYNISYTYPETFKNKLKGIKRVKIKYEEYKERKKREDKIRENDFKEYDWDYDNNPLYFHIVDAPERYGDEKLAIIPYSWGDGEVYSADSYADITKIENNDGTQVEFYSTKEIIEVLEKWLEMNEKWQDPEERAKMIEEYEKENGIEKDKGIIDRIRGWIGKKDKGEN